MKILTEKSRGILSVWSDEHNIQEIADIKNFTYKKIRNNYFKHFWKKGYLDRISKGRYILNKNGKEKIEHDLNFLKSEDIILKLSKKRFDNKKIKREIGTKLKLELTYPSIFTRISRLRKLYKIEDRRIKNIDDVKINKNFYEFLGLILSDGYINKYEVSFSNKDPVLLSHYINLISGKWNQKFYKRKKESGVTEISIYSKKLASLVNKFLNNKKHLSKNIVESKNNYQNLFLKGLYSGDGCITFSINYYKSKEKWKIAYLISLAVFNDKIMPFIIKILEAKGYSPTFNKDRIMLSKKKDIKKFNRRIRFIEGIKIRKSRYWNGLEKNKVLDYVSNYIGEDNKLRELVKEGNKENMINHIKNVLLEM